MKEELKVLGNAEILLNIVESVTNLKATHFIGGSRLRVHVTARCLYTNLLTLYTTLDLKGITDRIGRDRTSYYHMLKLHDDLMVVDKLYQTLFIKATATFVQTVCNNVFDNVDVSVLAARISKMELELAELKKILSVISVSEKELET